MQHTQVGENSRDTKVNQKQPFYRSLIHDNPGELVLSQRRDLLEQPLDFYELDALPATQPVVSKHYRKIQWFGRLLSFYEKVKVNYHILLNK